MGVGVGILQTGASTIIHRLYYTLEAQRISLWLRTWNLASLRPHSSDTHASSNLFSGTPSESVLWNHLAWGYSGIGGEEAVFVDLGADQVRMP